MEYILIPKFSGIEIFENSNKLTFTSKVFSLSSKIKNDDGEVVSDLKRIGWLHLKFRLNSSFGEYKLEGRWGKFILTYIDTGEEFENHFGVSFVGKNGSRVASINRLFGFRERLAVSINSELHGDALLMAICILYKSSIEG